MSLGEAFVEVHADLRPFARDLNRQIPAIAREFERRLTGAVGHALGNQAQQQGREIGDQLSRGMRNSLTHQFRNKNAFVVIASALAGALDDGISALPTEVKAAIVAGILAASPLLAGALGAAITAGVGAGLAVIGVVLGSQFESVQSRAVEVGRSLRQELVQSAADFEPAILHVLDMLEVRVRRLRPLLDQIFNVSSNFLEPLVEGGLDALEEVLNSTFSSLGKFKPFVDELGAAFVTLGDAVGDTLTILASTGESGQQALRDFVGLLGIALVSIGQIIFILTKLWGALRTTVGFLNDVAGPLSPLISLLDLFFDTIDRRTNESKSFVNTNTAMMSTFAGLIVVTKGQTDALQEYKKALDNVADASKTNLKLTLDWEDSLDRITESIRENGRTLDVTTEKGRNNVKEFIRGLEVAEERALLRVQRGEQTAEQAALQFRAETEALRKLATQAGISATTFDKLFSEIIETSLLRISASDMGLTELNGELGTGLDVASELHRTLLMIMNLRRNIGAGAIAGVRGFSDGGIQYLPTMATLAEDGAEAVIPLTKPARAAQILHESGLDQMFAGSGGLSQVFVYVGNEQLDARMVRIVERSNKGQAMALTQGPRRF